MSNTKIGAIWFLNESQANRIHNDFSESIWILLSECGKYWKGKLNSNIIKSCNDPYIGDNMNGESINQTDSQPAWESIRLCIIDNTLGDPISGKNSFGSSENKLEPDCKCDIISLMRYGCSSARGLDCKRSLK